VPSGIGLERHLPFKRSFDFDRRHGRSAFRYAVGEYDRLTPVKKVPTPSR